MSGAALEGGFVGHGSREDLPRKASIGVSRQELSLGVDMAW